MASMSLPTPMLGSNSTFSFLQVSLSSSTPIPATSTPAYSRMASSIGMRRYGALKSTLLPLISTVVVPLTARDIFSSIFSTNSIIQR